MTVALPADAKKDPACECCGSFEALEIAGKILCEECIENAGCSCADQGREKFNPQN